MEGFLLNEQTWLQHLKEKRLAYGLSQNRLAVATGITRQYLSDIETGKVKPSEDLQQSLWEALERFNPDAPLEMLFDYVLFGKLNAAVSIRLKRVFQST